MTLTSQTDLAFLTALWSSNREALAKMGWKPPALQAVLKGVTCIDGRITYLHLSGFQLTSIPPEIGNLTALEVLNLSFNQLSSLPAQLGNCSCLKELLVANNKLISLPSEIGKLYSVRTLNLHKNLLSSIPKEIGNMTRLQALYLSCNQLKSLPADIASCDALSLINVAKNKLTSIPMGMGQIEPLMTYILDDNCLTAASVPPKWVEQLGPQDPPAGETPTTSSASSASAAAAPPLTSMWSAGTASGSSGTISVGLMDSSYAFPSGTSSGAPAAATPPLTSQWATSSSPASSAAGSGQISVGFMDTNYSFSPANSGTSSTTSSSVTVPRAESTVDMSQVTLEKCIGRGTFGEVWKGDWLGTDVAVKNIIIRDEKQKELVIREVSIMQTIRHPNLVSLLGWSMADAQDNVKIVMEFMDGGGLDGLLKDVSQKLTWKRIRKTALDVAKGMACLHGQKPPVVHRDLKSLNILVDENGVSKVCDFGLSRTMGSASTMTNQTGTLIWMAPEVMNDEEYGPSADVYSFGIIMWELCSRKIPYADSGAASKLISFVTGIASGKLRPEIPANTPEAWATLMKRCWSSDPAARPPFSEIVNILKNMPLDEDASV